MSNIALIPIDNRPVCYDLPKLIINQANEHQIFLPDISLLGDLNNIANYNKLIEWINDLDKIDTIVIALDTIAYGGLIPSRRSSETIEQIKHRIDNLFHILKRKKIKIYAYSSIMRISNNNINEEEKEYWAQYGTKIFQYSYNLHKMEKVCDGENLIACNCAATRIPNDILNDYLNTRKRNFEINKYYIELKKLGFIDTLVFSKDDCSEFGLNVKEAEELTLLSKGIENIFIKTGADEIPIALLSRAINKDKYIKIAPVYTNPNNIYEISKYEDISVQESVKQQVKLCGGILSGISACDMVLLVNNFENEQGELVMNINTKLFDKELKLPQKPYFIADIVNANGSDNNFVNSLLKKENLGEFYGYAAWNTTGNTLGSCIATALTMFGAKQPNKSVFQTIQLIRFLDDWAYQANIRSKIKNNNENLSSTVLKIHMQEYENILVQKFNIKKPKITYKFPWNRFFEIKISLQDNYTELPFVDILFYE